MDRKFTLDRALDACIVGSLNNLDQIRDARVSEGLRGGCGLLRRSAVSGPAAKHDDAAHLDRAKTIDRHARAHELRRDVVRGRLDREGRDR